MWMNKVVMNALPPDWNGKVLFVEHMAGFVSSPVARRRALYSKRKKTCFRLQQHCFVIRVWRPLSCALLKPGEHACRPFSVVEGWVAEYKRSSAPRYSFRDKQSHTLLSSVDLLYVVVFVPGSFL